LPVRSNRRIGPSLLFIDRSSVFHPAKQDASVTWRESLAAPGREIEALLGL
jgi:hypothetical protein